MITNWSFRFHDVLDADMLHRSLEELISKGKNWAKLGGRFRLNVSEIEDNSKGGYICLLTVLDFDLHITEAWKTRASRTSRIWP